MGIKMLVFAFHLPLLPEHCIFWFSNIAGTICQQLVFKEFTDLFPTHPLSVVVLFPQVPQV